MLPTATKATAALFASTSKLLGLDVASCMSACLADKHIRAADTICLIVCMFCMYVVYTVGPFEGQQTKFCSGSERDSPSQDTTPGHSPIQSLHMI